MYDVFIQRGSPVQQKNETNEPETENETVRHRVQWAHTHLFACCGSVCVYTPSRACMYVTLSKYNKLNIKFLCVFFLHRRFHFDCLRYPTSVYPASKSMGLESFEPGLIPAKPCAFFHQIHFPFAVVAAAAAFIVVVVLFSLVFASKQSFCIHNACFYHKNVFYLFLSSIFRFPKSFSERHTQTPCIWREKAHSKLSLWNKCIFDSFFVCIRNVYHTHGEFRIPCDRQQRHSANRIIYLYIALEYSF